MRHLRDSASADLHIQNTARAALILLYLDKSNTRFNVYRATEELDQLYFRRSENAEQEALLFLALKIAVERSLEVMEANQLKLATEIERQELEQQIATLQTALEKLRRLSFQ